MAVLNLGFKGISFFKKIFFSDIPGYSLNTLHTLTLRHWVRAPLPPTAYRPVPTLCCSSYVLDSGWMLAHWPLSSEKEPVGITGKAKVVRRGTGHPSYDIDWIR